MCPEMTEILVLGHDWDKEITKKLMSGKVIDMDEFMVRVQLRLCASLTQYASPWSPNVGCVQESAEEGVETAEIDQQATETLPDDGMDGEPGFDAELAGGQGGSVLDEMDFT